MLCVFYSECMFSNWQKEVMLINYFDIQSCGCRLYYKCPDVGLFFQDAICSNVLRGAFFLCVRL